MATQDARTRPQPERRKTPVTTQAKKKLRTVSEIEKRFLRQRSKRDVFTDTVARFTGSFAFFILNCVWYALWVAVNTGRMPGVKPFDPYPFTFLTLMVSLEAIFLSIFVLSSQNRMGRMA